MGAQVPEPPECRCKPKKVSRTRTCPPQRDAKIIVVSFERGERSCLLFDSLLVNTLSNRQVIAEVSFAGILFLARFDEPLGTVLPQSFKQSIPQPIVVKLF